MASAASSAPAPVRVPGPLVSVAWLKQHYAGVRVLDGSFHMPAEKRDARAEFLQQHLPGARFFNLEDCVSREGDHKDLPHMLPTAAQLQAFLQERGVHSRSQCVVVYDTKGVFSAPRVRFTLRHFGMDNVAILQGGIKAWMAEGNDTESGEPKPEGEKEKTAAATASDSFAARPLEATPGVIRSMADVRANISSAAASSSDSFSSSSSSFLVVDARSSGRFRGTEPEPRPDLPSGHMPGPATNVPFTSLLDTDSAAGGATKLKSAQELQKAFAAAGVEASTPRTLVASCGSGVTACVALLGLEVLGRDTNVGLYDGSWSEWALRKNDIVSEKK